MLKDHLAFRLYKDGQQKDERAEKLTITEVTEKYELTKREHTILQLLMQGKDNHTICEELSISVNTLKKAHFEYLSEAWYQKPCSDV